MLFRVCSTCNEQKQENMFYKHISIKPDGIRKQCNECRNKYRRKAHKKMPNIKRKQALNWASANRIRINERAREYRLNNREKFKGYTLKRDFNITLIEYNLLLENQKGLCKLCDKPETSKHQSGALKSLAIDHCHKTMKIRGLLCWKCNTGIGKLLDDPLLLRKAADYIESNRKEL